MRSSYTPALAPEGARFVALARAIRADIRRGRLRPGDRLPGSRALAARLSLSRNTVVRACAELEAEGWLRAVPGSGLVIEEALPQVPDQVAVPDGGPGYALPTEPLGVGERRFNSPPGCRLAMQGGQPDLRLLPLTELARAYRRVLAGRGRRLVAYAPPEGTPRLRQALARWLAETRGLALDPDELLITRGSQMALFLAARALCVPGSRIAVESWGYPPAWAAFQAAGCTLEPVPVDEQGLVVEALFSRPPPAAVYLTPHHQYPTTVTLGPARRLALLAWARTHRVLLLEDDYDHEYHYLGTPILPLAASDPARCVLYIGTLSKAFAPGLRLGWIAAPRPVIRRLAGLRRIIDRQGDAVVEQAVAELLEEGLVQRHIRRTHRVYRARRAFLLKILEGLPITVRETPGGLALWCHSAAPVEAWAARAEARGVFFATARAFALDGRPRPWLRLGFAGLSEPELLEAVQILRETVPA